MKISLTTSNACSVWIHGISLQGNCLAWVGFLMIFALVISPMPSFSQTSAEASIELVRQRDNGKFIIAEGRSHIAVRTESQPMIRKGKVTSIQTEYLVLDSDTIPIKEITVIQGNLLRKGVLDYTQMRRISIVFLCLIAFFTLVFIIAVAPLAFTAPMLLTTILQYVYTVGFLWGLYLLFVVKRFLPLWIKRDFRVFVKAKS